MGGHRLYSTMIRKDVVFNHHDPLNRPEDHAYFVRACERLRLALACEELPLLCVLFSIERRAALMDSELDRLFQTLVDHYRGPSLRFVAVKIFAPADSRAAVGSRELRMLEAMCQAGGQAV